MEQGLGGDPGEITSLLAFLEEHTEALEADIARWYPGRRLAELFRGEMSFRELWVLINRLPQESWTQTALRDSGQHEDLQAPKAGADAGRKFGPWALTNYQLIDLIDAVRDVAWMTAVVASGQNQPERPRPSPRPGGSAARQQNGRGLTAAQLAQLRAERRQAPEGG